MAQRRAGEERNSGLALAVFATVLVVLLVLARAAGREGIGWFFRAGDPVFFRAVARDPFGTGHTIRTLGFGFEASYRYGRIGFPVLGSLFALGHAAWVEWALAALNLAAIAAVPALCIRLLDAHDVHGPWGALALAAPGLLILHDRAYVEPFLLAVILVAFVLDARGQTFAALAVLAYAILVKETAALALVPFVWRGVRTHDRKLVVRSLFAIAPYVMWACWVRLRVGEFPFSADDPSRRNALGLPFAGMVRAVSNHTPDAVTVVVVVIVTGVFAIVAAYVARSIPIASAAAAFGVQALCAGPETLRYLGETLRLMVVPQVLAIVCAVYAVQTRNKVQRLATPASAPVLTLLHRRRRSRTSAERFVISST